MRSAAYNERAALTDERTGERFSFAHRDAPEHHEVLLPEGADERLRDSAMLWNAAEAAEKRKDAQVAREIVLTLPADRELTAEDRIELARSFAQQHFVAKGLAVQLDVHAPHEGSAESERANHHAHLLITTRRIEGDHLAARKARDVEPVVRAVAGRPVVAEGEAWGAVWREHQDRYFQAHGLELRVDPLATHAQEHLGPVRMRVVDAEANVRAEEIAAANRAAARDPDQVLATLTRENATFTERELDRLLARHLHDEQEHLAVKATVFGHRDVLALHDPATGEDVRRYTTRQVRAQERTALADAARVARGRQRAVEAGAQEGALETRSLREDQRRAFEHAVAAGGLKIIEGRAGTGKSHTLQAVRDAHERAGCRVLGLAPTNAVAQDLKTEGFAEAGTVHSALFRLKNGLGEAWSARTVVIVDEAAMLDARVTGELLHEARRSGAKVILAGDDRQLTSIERGGLFAELRQRHGSVEISQVTRQRADWQRQAARDLAEGRIGEAVHAFARHGAISWSRTQDEALERLVARWTADTAAEPAATRFVFAYANADVDRLNTALWQVRRERGEFGTEHRFATRHGAMEFAVGDRVQLTATLKRAGLYNGQAGTITGIDAATGVIRARLDGPAGGEGREVSWSAREFDGFRHGHAGTIDKGQGRTLDHTYLHHSHHWRHASSYVALTRQRERATIFAATETARDVGQLARQMSRSEVRAASVAWATRDELPARLRIQADAPKIEPVGVRADRADVATGRPAEGYRATTTRRGLLTAPAVRMEPRSADLGWLIPPRLSPDGRDSLGRRLDPGSVATVVAADRAVQREGEALKHYLQGTYRDSWASSWARQGACRPGDAPGAGAGPEGGGPGRGGRYGAVSRRLRPKRGRRSVRCMRPRTARRTPRRGGWCRATRRSPES